MLRRVSNVLLFCLLGWNMLSGNVLPQDDVASKGRLLIREQNWPAAATYFRRISESQQEGEQNASARFWWAYALENMPESELEAFEIYRGLIKDHAGSLWADYALIHQIFIGRKRLERGQKDQVRFLEEQLSNSKSEPRYHAAFALANIRHNGALPVLVEASAQNDLNLVRQAMDALKVYGETLNPDAKSDMPDLASIEQADISDGDKLLVRHVLRKPATGWTPYMLQLNGLYHIVPIQQLVHMLKLKSQLDRDAWIDRFWKRKDPTPTTERNEAREAFNRRVIYVASHYMGDWDMASRGYPPWDARGELYIRMGPPDQEAALGRNWQEWTYYGRRMILYVHDNRPNNEGRSVEISSVARYLEKAAAGQETTQIYSSQPRFDYQLPMDHKIIDLECTVHAESRHNGTVTVTLEVQFDPQSLRLKRVQDAMQRGYELTWVVLNEAYEEISRNKDGQFLAVKTDEPEAPIIRQTSVSLKPGRYVAAVRVEDVHAEALGITKHMFRIIKTADGTCSLLKQ